MEWTTVISSFLGAAVGVVVSMASDRLRARIQGEFWLAQERWKLKAEIYSNMLKLLHREVEGMKKVTALLSSAQDPEEHSEEARLPEHIDKQIGDLIKDDLAPDASELRELARLGALWLSGPTVAALREAAETVSAPYYVDRFQKQAASLERAIELIVKEADADLRLHVRGV